MLHNIWAGGWEKGPYLEHMQSAKIQTRLCILSVWSESSLFPCWRCRSNSEDLDLACVCANWSRPICIFYCQMKEKREKSHEEMQKAQSRRQLEQAKQANIEKLVRMKDLHMRSSHEIHITPSQTRFVCFDVMTWTWHAHYIPTSLAASRDSYWQRQTCSRWQSVFFLYIFFSKNYFTWNIKHYFLRKKQNVMWCYSKWCFKSYFSKYIIKCRISTVIWSSISHC